MNITNSNANSNANCKEFQYLFFTILHLRDRFFIFGAKTIKIRDSFDKKHYRLDKRKI